jgi:hypothetical protein
MCEEVLADLYNFTFYPSFSFPSLTHITRSSASDPDWLTMSLRYTNPSGAHPSGYIGEVICYVFLNRYDSADSLSRYRTPPMPPTSCPS